MYNKTLSFFRDVVEEVKKLHFPSKKETYVTTTMIVVAVLLASLLVSFADLIISKTVGLVFGL